ncbi:hypothetical protein OG474_41870 [Kribbella sp. NBC_01505]|uniref:hypothetical protein n=1 Tax=Kribbella sp. NBC_01505 TaxID=2903580 RepID=UPI003868B8AC
MSTRRIVTTLGLVTAALITLTTAPVALAQPGPAEQSWIKAEPLADGSTQLTILGSPGAGSGFAPAAVPTTSPAVSRQFVPSGQQVNCPTGYACAVVIAIGGGGYFFKFYNYGTYTLSNWTGIGEYRNYQTGGAAFRAYGSAGQSLGCMAAGTGSNEINWNPIYTLKLTAAPC